MEAAFAQRLDEQFFKIVRGPIGPAEKKLVELFDPSVEFTEDEALSPENQETVEYLFNIAAMTFSSDSRSGLIHPVLSIPGSGEKKIFEFIVARLQNYAKTEPKIKFTPIDCNELVGTSPMKDSDSESIDIPNIWKWLMEHEREAFGTKLILLYNFQELAKSTTLNFDEVFNTLSQLSGDTAFILFSSPSGFNTVKSQIKDQKILDRFARIKTISSFSEKSPDRFAKILTRRLSDSNLPEISFDDLALSLILSLSKGVPEYAFRLSSRAVRNALISQNNTVTSSTVNEVKKEFDFEKIWDDMELLTPKQLDLLSVLINCPNYSADAYELRTRLQTFRKFFGARSALVQQLRKLYQNNILERNRGEDLKVQYSVRELFISAIEKKIEESTLQVN